MTYNVFSGTLNPTHFTSRTVSYCHRTAGVKGCLFQVVDEERMVGVSALCFLQCFDTVGWVTGRTASRLVHAGLVSE